MIDPTIIVAFIMGGSGVLVALVQKGLRRAGSDAEKQVDKEVEVAGEEAAAEAQESARQVVVDAAGVVEAAIAAAVKPVYARLEHVEADLRVLRGDLVPVAVADRGIVVTMVANGILERDRVVVIPETVSPLYPPHLRHLPPLKKENPDG